MNSVRKTSRIVGVAVALVLSVCAASWAQASTSGAVSGDKSAVNTACSSEAATASCGTETVGHGLIKCIHAYKKANPSFQISTGCKTAMKQLRADHRSQKTAESQPTATPSTSTSK